MYNLRRFLKKSLHDELSLPSDPEDLEAEGDYESENSDIGQNECEENDPEFFSDDEDAKNDGSRKNDDNDNNEQIVSIETMILAWFSGNLRRNENYKNITLKIKHVLKISSFLKRCVQGDMSPRD